MGNCNKGIGGGKDLLDLLRGQRMRGGKPRKLSQKLVLFWLTSALSPEYSVELQKHQFVSIKSQIQVEVL